jgi:hypothetical protein
LDNKVVNFNLIRVTREVAVVEHSFIITQPTSQYLYVVVVVVQEKVRHHGISQPMEVMQHHIILQVECKELLLRVVGVLLVQLVQAVTVAAAEMVEAVAVA